MKDLKNYVIEKTIEELENYEGIDFYACDLSYTLFEGYNVDGTMAYSTKEAKEFIKEYWDDIGEVYEECAFQFGGDFMKDYNPFYNPEKFMVLIVIESANYLIGRCPTIEKNWNGDKLTLDTKMIKTITKELNEIKEKGGSIYE